MRSGVRASKLAQLMQSASRVGIALRTKAPSRRRSSRSSCTTRQRAVPRLTPTIAVDSDRSVLLAEGLLIGGDSLFRQAKCDSQFGADRDRFPTLRQRLVAHPPERSRRSRVEDARGA